MRIEFSNFPKKIFVFAILSLQTVGVSAVEKVDSTKIYEIKEITVKGKFSNTETQSSAPVQILSAGKMNKLNVLQVSDAARYFSGVTVKDFGGIGGLKTISVRSFGAAHTAVSYDGVTITDCQTGQIDIGRYSLENVDMISLNNGQSDNIFQSARLFASAAVLNIRSVRPVFSGNKTMNGSLTFRSGSFGLLNPSFSLQNRLSEKFSAVLSAEILSANGKYPYLLHYSAQDDGLVSHEIRKNSDVHNVRLEASLFGRLNTNSSGFIKTYFYQSERGLPGATVFYNADNFSSQRLKDYNFFTQAHFENIVSPLFSVQFNGKFYHGYLHYSDTTYLNEEGKIESIYRQNEYYGSASVLFHPVDQFYVSFSTDGFINNMTANFETKSLNDEFAGPTRYSLLSVVAARYVSSAFTATSSLLSTLVSEKVQVGNPSPQQKRLSPYAGISFKPIENTDLRIRAFYKSIFRLPSFNDLYYSRTGNENLRPELTDQFNIGATYSASISHRIPSLIFTMDVYRNYVKDKIIAMPTKNIFVWSMLNLGRVEVNGLDLTAESSFLLTPGNNIVIGSTYTYQRALDVTSPGGNTFQHQIPYTPRVSGTFRAGVETSLINVYYSLLWSGKRYSGFQNYAENRLPGYSDHSLSASRIFQMNDKQIHLKFEVLNLLNENYAVVRWFPMPGRSFRITANLKF